MVMKAHYFLATLSDFLPYTACGIWLCCTFTGVKEGLKTVKHLFIIFPSEGSINNAKVS
jgi:hypothetical protein